MLVYVFAGMLLPALAMLVIVHYLNPIPPKRHRNITKKTYAEY